MKQLSWWLLVKALHWWAINYMENSSKFKFMTKYGTVYVSIDRQNQYPNAFNLIDPNGNSINTYTYKENVFGDDKQYSF